MDNQVKLLQAALKVNPGFRLSLPTLKKLKEEANKKDVCVQDIRKKKKKKEVIDEEDGKGNDEDDDDYDDDYENHSDYGESEEDDDNFLKKERTKNKLFFGLFDPKKKKIRSVGKFFLAVGWDIEVDTSLSTVDQIFLNLLVFFFVYCFLDLFIFKIKYE